MKHKWEMYSGEVALRNIREISFVSAHGVVLIRNRPPVKDGRTLFSNSSSFKPSPLSLSLLPRFKTLFNFWHARIEGCNLENDCSRDSISHLSRQSTGQECDIFQLLFPRELTLVTPGVHRGDTRNEKRRKDAHKKKKKKSKRKKTDEEKKKRSKYIDSECVPLRRETRSGKLDTSIKLASTRRRTDLLYVHRALELVTFNWRSWWQLTRAKANFV